MLKNGAPLDSFSVGTRHATSANFNSFTGKGGTSDLGGVYKLVQRDGEPVGKQSLDEHTKAMLTSDTDDAEIKRPLRDTARLIPIRIDGSQHAATDGGNTKLSHVLLSPVRDRHNPAVFIDG